jgi:hAT family C-terminal dimerisation region
MLAVDLCRLIPQSTILLLRGSNSNIITKYPVLALMARDIILAIPASEVGVERVFNHARDICHYRYQIKIPTSPTN